MQPTEIQGLGQPVAAEPEDKNTVGTDDFLRMLIAQLENQDPLNPQDPTEFTAQLAQFTNLEQQIAIRDGVEELVSLQRPEEGANATDTLLQSLTATSMIGREVLAAASHFEVHEGNQTPQLDFHLAAAAPDVRIEIRDERGILIRTLEDAEIAPGNAALAQGPQSITWDGKNLAGNDVPDGVYSYEVTATNGGVPVPVQTLLTGVVTS